MCVCVCAPNIAGAAGGGEATEMGGQGLERSGGEVDRSHPASSCSCTLNIQRNEEPLKIFK